MSSILTNEEPEDNRSSELTTEQEHELDRRIDGFHQNPHTGRTWEQIKAEFFNSR